MGTELWLAVVPAEENTEEGSLRLNFSFLDFRFEERRSLRFKKHKKVLIKINTKKSTLAWLALLFG